MKIGIMQPYFFPYLGYWQIMNMVDKYIIYDNIQYTKKGWFNRNRFLQNGHDELFSINIEKASDFLDVRDRNISPVFDRKKLLEQFRNAYRKAPYFAKNFPIIEQIVMCPENNLFKYLFNSIQTMHDVLGMKTQLIISSDVDIDHSKKSSEKVKALVLAVGGTEYINPVGGMDLYKYDDFKNAGIDLKFHKISDVTYKQFNNAFIPCLSIVDVLMFNSIQDVKQMLNAYTIIQEGR